MGKDKNPNKQPGDAGKQGKAADAPPQAGAKGQDQAKLHQETLASAYGSQAITDKNKAAAPQAAEAEANLSQLRLAEAAKELNQAITRKQFGNWGLDNPNIEALVNILEPMRAPDRQALMKIYRSQYGHDLLGDISTVVRTTSPDFQLLKQVLGRQDGVPDVVGQLKWATARIDDHQGDQRANERVLIDAIAGLSTDQIAQLRKSYGEGKDPKAELLKNRNISEETRLAINYFFKGNLNDQDVAALAQLGLDSKRADIFNYAFQNASDKARQDFLKSGGAQAIDETFSGIDRQRAHDYVEHGQESPTTQVAGDHGVFFVNKEHIEYTISNMKDDKRKDYADGEKLAKQYAVGEDLARSRIHQHTHPGTQACIDAYQRLSSHKASADEQRAFNFYNELHAEMSKGSSQREVKLWEAEILRKEDIIPQLAKAHSDGGPLGLGSGHDAQELYKIVENLSPTDWQKFHAHKEDLIRVDETLAAFTNDQERAKLMAMLREKVNAESFPESQQVGRRTAKEVIEQNRQTSSDDYSERVPLGYRHGSVHVKEVSKIDAIYNFSDKERNAYKNNTDGFRDQFDKSLQTELRSQAAKALAKRLLDGISGASHEVPNAASEAINSVLDGAVRGVGLHQTIENIEKAFAANPGGKDSVSLLKRLHNPQNDRDRALADEFKSAMEQAVDRAGLGDKGMLTQAPIAGRYEEFTKPLFATGQVPLDLKTAVADDMGKLDCITKANKSEHDRLIDTKPDAKTKAFQDAVLGTDTGRSLREAVAAQGKMTLADECRAFSLGYNEDYKSLQEKLKQLDGHPEKAHQLAQEYFKKYGRPVTSDVLANNKIPESIKTNFRELFSEAPVTLDDKILHASKNRAERAGPLDGVGWDATKTAADEAVDQLIKLKRQYNGMIKDLPQDSRERKLLEEKREQVFKALDKCQEEEKNFADSRVKQSEALTDAAITAATIIASFTPLGVEAGPAMLARFAVIGGSFRLATAKAIQGRDLNLNDPQVVLNEVFKGSSAAVLGLVGPAHFGFPMGEAGVKGAWLAAGLEKAGAKSGASALFDATTQKVLGERLAGMKGADAILGGGKTEATIARILSDHAAQGVTKDEIQAAAKTYYREFQKQAALQGLAKEGTQWLANVSTASLANVGAEGGAIAVGLEKPTSPEDMFNKLAGSAVAGAAGATFFHFTFKGAGAAFSGAHGAIGKFGDKYFAGEGTTIQHADKTYETVGKIPYFCRKGDMIVRPTESAHLAPPSEAAHHDSNDYTRKHVLDKDMPDGFTDAGAGRPIGKDGGFTGPRAATTFDANDPVFQHTLAEAQKRFGNLSPAEKKDALTKYVQEVFTVNPKLSAAENAKLTDALYVKLMDDNQGKRIGLGEFIHNKIGGCAQQAMLLKALGDRMLPPNERFVLVRGNGSDAGNSINHVWLTSKDGKLIYDPRQGFYGEPVSAHKDTHKAGSEMTFAQRVGLTSAEGAKLEVGRRVGFGDDAGWKVRGHSADGKTVDLSHDGAVATTSKNLLPARGDGPIQLKVTEQVRIKNPDGTTDDGWAIQSINKRTGEVIVWKPDAVKKMNVPVNELSRHIPELAPGRGGKVVSIKVGEGHEIDRHGNVVPIRPLTVVPKSEHSANSAGTTESKETPTPHLREGHVARPSSRTTQTPAERHKPKEVSGSIDQPAKQAEAVSKTVTKIDTQLADEKLSQLHRDKFRYVKSILTDPITDKASKKFIDDNWTAIKALASSGSRDFQEQLNCTLQLNKEGLLSSNDGVNPKVLLSSALPDGQNTERVMRAYVEMSSKLKNIEQEIENSKMPSCLDMKRLSLLTSKGADALVSRLNDRSKIVDLASAPFGVREDFRQSLRKLADLNDCLNQLAKDPNKGDLVAKQLATIVPGAERLFPSPVIGPVDAGAAQAKQNKTQPLSSVKPAVPPHQKQAVHTTTPVKQDTAHPSAPAKPETPTHPKPAADTTTPVVPPHQKPAADTTTPVVPPHQKPAADTTTSVAPPHQRPAADTTTPDKPDTAQPGAPAKPVRQVRQKQETDSATTAKKPDTPQEMLKDKPKQLSKMEKELNEQCERFKGGSRGNDYQLIRDTLLSPTTSHSSKEFIVKNWDDIQRLVVGSFVVNRAKGLATKLDFKGYFNCLLEPETQKLMGDAKIKEIALSQIFMNERLKSPEEALRSYLKLNSRLEHISGDMTNSAITTCTNKADLGNLVEQEVRKQLAALTPVSNLASIQAIAKINQALDKLGGDQSQANGAFKELTEAIPAASKLKTANADQVFESEHRTQTVEQQRNAYDENIKRQRSESSGQLQTVAKTFSAIGITADESSRIVQTFESIIKNAGAKDATAINESLKKFSQIVEQASQQGPGSPLAKQLRERLQCADKILAIENANKLLAKKADASATMQALLNPNVGMVELKKYEGLLARTADPKKLFSRFSEAQSIEILAGMKLDLERIVRGLAKRDTPASYVSGREGDPFINAAKTLEVLGKLAHRFEEGLEPNAQLAARRVDVVADLLKVNLNCGGRCKIDWDKVLDCQGMEGIEFYDKLISQSAEIQGPHSSETGFTYEHDAAQKIQDVLARNKYKGGNWVFVPSAHASPADAVGIDGVLLNLDRNVVVPVDFKSSTKILTEKIDAGKGLWAIHIPNPESCSDGDILSGLDKFFAGTRTARGTEVKPPVMMLSEFEAIPGQIGISGKVPFPSFRNVQSDVIANKLGVKTSKQEVVQLAKTLESTRSLSPGLRHLNDRAWSAIFHKTAEERLATEVNQALSVSVHDLSAHMVDARTAGETAGKMFKVQSEIGEEMNSNGRKKFDYFDLKEPLKEQVSVKRPNGTALTGDVEITRIKFDRDGNVFAVDAAAKRESPIELGNLKTLLRMQLGDDLYEHLESLPQGYRPTDQQIFVYIMQNRKLWTRINP